jgi:hypothetical protein
VDIATNSGAKSPLAAARTRNLSRTVLRMLALCSLLTAVGGWRLADGWSCASLAIRQDDGGSGGVSRPSIISHRDAMGRGGTCDAREHWVLREALLGPALSTICRDEHRVSNRIGRHLKCAADRNAEHACT